MALNDVVFKKQQGGLGRALPGSDYLSGAVFYTGNLPSGFTTSLNKKQIFQVSDAEALGIVDTYIDETQAIAIITLTGSPTVGDTLTISITEPGVNGTTKVVVLPTGIAPATPTLTTYAAAVVAAINGGSYANGVNGLTGYTATNTAGVISLISRKGTGVSLNTGSPVAVVETGATIATITQQFGTATGGATAGVYSQLSLWHYQISEFFRTSPSANLWIGFYPVPSALSSPAAYSFPEIQDLQNFANGTLRQALIYHTYPRTAALVASDCTAIQASEIISETAHKPFSVVYAPNIAAIADLSTLSNLALLTANKASVVIAQDVAAQGGLLFITSGVSTAGGGTLLGAIATAAVNEDIAWVAKFNMSDGVEFDIIGFANGQLSTAVSSNLKNQLDSYRYIFLRNFVDFTGSYFNDSHCAISQASDYAYIENNRTIDKAIRVGRAALLPLLNSPILVNADGTITGNSIAIFRAALQTAADPMIRAGEISADGITIDPTQNILSTSNFYIKFQIVPTGTARNIITNIGYASSVSSS